MRSMNTLEAIRARRSLGRLTDPAPNDEELQTLLEAAVLAPDHKGLRPWRFIILRGASKEAFGEVMRRALLQREPTASDGQQDKERNKFSRAPLVVVVAVKRVEASIPFSELYSATAAAVQNMLLAATDMGYGSMWRTGAATYDHEVKAALGLERDDEILGFVYLGTAGGEAPMQREPDLEGIVWSWPPGASITRH